jgi:hypothetical protein
MEKPGIFVLNKKKMRMPGFLLLIYMLASCNTSPEQYRQTPGSSHETKVAPRTVGDIPVPPGYQRIKPQAGSYASFLQKIALKKDRTVYLYNGIKKGNQQAQYAVIDLDAGDKDLQQCADAVMRLRAEYLFAEKNYNNISFTFTNGFTCDFTHYAKGYRLRVIGNNCHWLKQAPESYSYSTFRQYLDLVYTYAGTKSLHHQLKSIVVKAIHPGAVFIQTRNPYGHAVTVMDMAYNPQTKDTIFLLSQSYMPAQDIHILVNPANNDLSPWYSVHTAPEITTPEWTFTWGDLKEF